MRTLLFVITLLSITTLCPAKMGTIQAAGDLSEQGLQKVIERCEASLPKFWTALTDVRNQGVDVRITNEKKMGPGKASGTNRIVLSARYLTEDLPQFPEDRLIIVLYHEFGHILLNRQTDKSQRNPVKHEFFAFSYSVMMAKKMAEKGDSGPLEQVIKNLKLRSKRGRQKDPHNIAIKQLMETPLWNECTAILNIDDRAK